MIIYWKHTRFISAIEKCWLIIREKYSALSEIRGEVRRREVISQSCLVSLTAKIRAVCVCDVTDTSGETLTVRCNSGWSKRVVKRISEYATKQIEKNPWNNLTGYHVGNNNKSDLENDICKLWLIPSYFWSKNSLDFTLVDALSISRRSSMFKWKVSRLGSKKEKAAKHKLNNESEGRMENGLGEEIYAKNNNNNR